VWDWFNYENAVAWNIMPAPEQRLRLTPTRYRVADLCVYPKGTTVFDESDATYIFTRPPLIPVEVQSPEDTVVGIFERLEDYEKFGIEHNWLIDPKTRHGWAYHKGNLIRQERFEVPGTPIYLSLDEMFLKVDPDIEEFIKHSCGSRRVRIGGTRPL
jgi:Uma2 family endonuclease